MDLRESYKYYENIFSNIGKTENNGLTRLLYTDEWANAQRRMKEEMEAIGMEANFDAVGNLIGTLVGTDENPKVIATGSHIDSVVEGGNLDGQYGILAGLSAVRDLVKEYGKPKNSLQVISMAEEEGSRFPYVFWGSKNLFNMITPEDKKEVEKIEDGSGHSFVSEMRKHGFDFKSEEDEPVSIDKFIEIHIEQGNYLEMINKPIGVITAITGQKRYKIRIKGQANHAGTTRMSYRKDAIYAYSKIVKSSIEMAEEEGDPLVITFGNITVVPNTVNVVPGEVVFSMDCRHPDGYILNNFTKKIEKNMKSIVDEMNMEIELDMWMNAPPVPMDHSVINTIENTVKEMGIDYEVMHSGAGHDSQIFAPRVPTGMIFVPSIDGISHNPAEKTKDEDLFLGIEVLKNTLHKLAY
ncbi:MAG: allantoate deiminase [Gallicola sp.]|nr:allantoate deiminase [Gallicola sp.]